MPNPIHIQITELVAELTPQLIRWRQDLHKHPEPAWQEFRTTALVATTLQDLGYAVRMGPEVVSPHAPRELPAHAVLACACERAIREGADPALVARMGDGLTGVVGELGGGTAGEKPLLALRFDIDANPLQECEAPDHRPVREGFASIHPGCAHACGHDGHTALGLGLATLCARLYARSQATLPYRLRFIFQPAEEGAQGARAMLAAGVMDGVDLLVGVHLGIQADSSRAVICGTQSMLASSKLNVRVFGAAAHAAASPEQGKNALLAACAIIQNLYAIPPHSDGLTRLNVGRIEGGDSRNIIAPLCRFELETRGETTELDTYMRESALRIIQAGAGMWGCVAEVEDAGQCDGGHSDLALARRVAQAAAGCYDEVRESGPFKASEDFASLLRAVQAGGGQGTFIQAGIDRAAPHHAARFDFDEATLVPALEMLGRFVFGK